MRKKRQGVPLSSLGGRGEKQKKPRSDQMAQQEVYFARAHVTEREKSGTVTFERKLLATSKDDAKEQMRRYVASQLPDSVWTWEISIFTKDEEDVFRSLRREGGASGS